jgi:tRNA-splicing endonuclease subunit Sen2
MAATQPSVTHQPGAASAALTADSQDVRRAHKSTKSSIQQLHQLYALPAPIRTFPLPAFYPNNPLSIVHLAYAWLNQFFFTPREPAIIHEGVWSSQTGAVLVKGPTSIRALWEQGFYGKGHLSRSEPEWFKREQVRRGLVETHVSQLHTAKRREERRAMKWERAKAELEAIRQTRLQEAREGKTVAPPVGPLELLALPNSLPASEHFSTERDQLNEAGPSSLPAAVNSDSSGEHAHLSIDQSETGSPVFEREQTMKRRKSVRFSPEVNSTTVDLLAPPSPELAALNGNGYVDADVAAAQSESESTLRIAESRATVSSDDRQVSNIANELVDKEHLQLTREEAFFLSFGLGVLKVIDPESQSPIAPHQLFELFRRYSYVPPREGSSTEALRPDDQFLVDYVIYHHFRSLGWAPRPGIKFGTDWLLYFKGPPFDHAQYGVMVLPSYTHTWWKDRGQRAVEKDWAWFHRVSRTLSHALKTTILAYVDIPPPPVFEEALNKGIVHVLKLYTVREIVTKRFTPNRERKA